MFELISFGVLVIVGYFVGSRREAQHYKDIEERERIFLYMPIRVGKSFEQTMSDAQLVSSSIVVANDYFKAVATSIKSFIGGQVRSQESLLDRARREATLRLKSKAKNLGANEIIGYRMETSVIDRSGVEICVYGTAVKNASLHS